MTRSAAYSNILGRLSHQSVVKHFDAYADVPWDHPDYRIDATDARWELDENDVLGGTEWYRTQPREIRSRLGLHGIVTQMKLGVEFEAILSQGLLQFATSLPNGAPEFRYAYHEAIEEGQHSLMFQEFINRSGLEVRGMGGVDAWFSRRVPSIARSFPELFFLFVLGGESPIDYVQREELRKRDALHPLLRRVMQIHVTEEARHLCFAKNYLLENVPKLGRIRRFQLRFRTPIIFAAMAKQMLEPPKALIREYGIPSSVVREAYTENPVHRQRTLDGLASVRKLCFQLGLVQPRWWRMLGILPEGEGDARDAFDDESGVRRLGPPRPTSVPTSSRRLPGVVRACPRSWVQPLSA